MARDLALLGFGDVGQALAGQLVASETPFRVTSISDTRGTLVDEDGLALADVLQAEAEGESVVAGPGRREGWSSIEAARRAPADTVVQLTPSDLEDPRRGLEEITAALSAGREVVTAAKDALACRPGDLPVAPGASDRLRYSASVGGSTPVLELLDRAFAGDRLAHLTGVLNGSTTYVLSRLEEGVGFGQALDDAREAGLLEADPKADLLGLDAGAKAAILHQRAYGSQLSLGDVPIEGITDVGPEECRRAREQGMAIRLVARVDAQGARVRPVELPAASPLVGEGPRACVRLVLQGAGEIVLEGPGAGPRETAAAVLADVIALREATHDPGRLAASREGAEVPRPAQP